MENARNIFLLRNRLKSPDRQLAKFIVNASISMNILDDNDFSLFCLTLRLQYTLPSRGYMLNNVITPMFQETYKYIKKTNKCKNIGLTADAWTYLNQKSYKTVTAHTIDAQGDLHHYVLDTNEIKVRNTSENLLTHISRVLVKYNLKDRNNAINTAINTTIPDDDADSVNYLIEPSVEQSQPQSQPESQPQSQPESKSQSHPQPLDESQDDSHSEDESILHSALSTSLSITMTFTITRF